MAEEAHPHQGKGQKFDNPTKAELSEEEVGKLAAGESVFKHVQEESGGRGVAVFDVEAEPELVWEVITNFYKYPEWIEEITKAHPYQMTDDKILVNFVISLGMGVEVTYNIDHTYLPDKGYMTWTLDYSKKSDLDDSTGYWLVYESPIDGKTRVEYTVNLLVNEMVPEFVQTMLAETGVQNATIWVKREAEAMGAI